MELDRKKKLTGGDRWICW